MMLGRFPFRAMDLSLATVSSLPTTSLSNKGRYFSTCIATIPTIHVVTMNLPAPEMRRTHGSSAAGMSLTAADEDEDALGLLGVFAVDVETSVAALKRR